MASVSVTPLSGLRYGSGITVAVNSFPSETFTLIVFQGPLALQQQTFCTSVDQCT
ncbi:hypothetical protein RchiOBHm_Chr7g0221711 [Rosa chinensis]|uniref:Uncharacterized protein n=1 Tax=Rosa chinensis TaxID=74649 RepID=A0A2P6PD32_ROSCH|nr:hypothetical protein RchiOBHm_Chr7g0221711 [Rosa chinensis]